MHTTTREHQSARPLQRDLMLTIKHLKGSRRSHHLTSSLWPRQCLCCCSSVLYSTTTEALKQTISPVGSRQRLERQSRPRQPYLVGAQVREQDEGEAGQAQQEKTLYILILDIQFRFQSDSETEACVFANSRIRNLKVILNLNVPYCTHFHGIYKKIFTCFNVQIHYS